jgi:cysteine desulfurase family protein (TIGR01976 family)
MQALDQAWVRARFPALAEEIDGRLPVFFDGPGGSQVPEAVMEAMARYLVTSNANAHGAFATSRETDALIDAARAAVADFLGCAADEIVFGANMTTLAYALSRAIGRELRPRDEIVVTRLDHYANVSPWRALEEERGVVVRTVDIRADDCSLDMEDLARQISPRTRLVAVGYASNAVGTVNDVAAAVRLARAAGAWTFVDAVHYAPHGPIDARALDCDFLACSAYKFYGPHVGVLYGKRERLARLRPYRVEPAADTVPVRWETGTLNHEGLAGLKATVDYLEELGRRVSPSAPDRRAALVAAMAASRDYERGLSERLIAGLARIPGLRIYGIVDPERFASRTPTVAVRLAGLSPAAAAAALGERGIFAWHGNFYALGLTQRLGVEDSGGFLRIGLLAYNTAAEIDRLLVALGEIAEAA